MARETKAQRLARELEETAQRVEVAKATYTERMMAVLERAAKENFELEVRDGKFRVEDRDDRRFSGTFYLPPAWDTMSDVDLFQLEVAVELKEEARLEREQKANARAAALAKLNAFERDLLGL
jgi:FtsZ-binding cell division protein ZapB